MRDSLGRYLEQIDEASLLDPGDERALCQIIERGVEAKQRKARGETSRSLDNDIRDAEAAKDRFVRANLRLVVSIARRYPLPTGMDLLDLIQEGNIGLEHAVDKFDWRKGFKFSTYATFWVRQSIRRALDSRGSLVRLPEDRLIALRNASGDDSEMDAETALAHRMHKPVSLDRSLGDEIGGKSLADLLPDAGPGPEVRAMAVSEQSTMVGLLGVLDPRRRGAVERRFGLIDGRKRTFRDLGAELGISHEAARRLVRRAISVIRDHAESLSIAETAQAAPGGRRPVR